MDSLGQAAAPLWNQAVTGVTNFAKPLIQGAVNTAVGDATSKFLGGGAAGGAGGMGGLMNTVGKFAVPVLGGLAMSSMMGGNDNDQAPAQTQQNFQYTPPPTGPQGFYGGDTMYNQAKTANIGLIAAPLLNAAKNRAANQVLDNLSKRKEEEKANKTEVTSHNSADQKLIEHPKVQEYLKNLSNG